MINKRQSAQHRRQAAIHEAGHLWMARHLGLPSIGAMLWPTPTNPKQLWRGAAHVPGVHELPDFSRRAVSIAGGAAVMVDAEIPARDFSKYKNLLSEKDWSDFGTANDLEVKPALIWTMNVLRKNWNEVRRLAREIIIKSRGIA